MNNLLTLLSASGDGGGSTGANMLTEFELYGEDYDSSSSFSSTSSHTITKTGTITKTLAVATLGGRASMDTIATGSHFTSTPITTEKKNYAIFTVMWVSGSSSGNMFDWRSDPLVGYKMILQLDGSASTTLKYYYGQTGTLSHSEAVAGQSSGQFWIRLYLFEESVGRVFVSGGAAKTTGAFEATALNETGTLQRRNASGTTVKGAYYGVHTVPLGNTFIASELDAAGDALATYYAGGSSTVTWSPITL